MTGWQNTTRRQQLPPNWPTLRTHILNRAGHRCEALMRNGERCRDRATDVDHKTPGNNHHPNNLQALCTWHHNRKSAQEGNEARKRLSTQRPTEQHPGITDPNGG